MNIYEVAEALKENKFIQAYALNPVEHEVFLVDYSDDPGQFTDVVISYAKGAGSSGEEDSLSIDEFLQEFEYAEELKFRPLARNSSEALDLEYRYAVEILKENGLK